MDIGPRIKLARAKAGLSVRELAERVGVSATAISKFERGEASPRQSTLLRLAKALSVGVEYFFREVKVETLNPAYRKHSKLGKRLQEAIEATIVEAVERHLLVEELFPKGFFPESKLPSFPTTSVDEAERAADELRRQWKLGSDPIEDLCGRLENRGIKVIAIDAPKGFDGFSCWVNGQIPVIAYNVNAPGDRQRFNLAHELGHLVLDADPPVDVEKAAHRFAGAFLVPAEAVHVELGRKRSDLSLDELLLLKNEYGVSIQAWIRRAFDLEIIDRDTYNTLFRRLSQRGWRTEEPGSVSLEKPRRLRLLIHQALAERLITPSYAATLLHGGSRTVKPKPKEFPQPKDDLVREYMENRELTAFEDVDLEDFHEYEDRQGTSLESQS